MKIRIQLLEDDGSEHEQETYQFPTVSFDTAQRVYDKLCEELSKAWVTFRKIDNPRYP